MKNPCCDGFFIAAQVINTIALIANAYCTLSHMEPDYKQIALPKAVSRVKAVQTRGYSLYNRIQAAKIGRSVYCTHAKVGQAQT